MTSDPHAHTQATPPGVARQSAFLTTRWTLVRLAKADSNDGRQALQDLCEAYYEPVAAFLGAQLRDSETARDLAHGFFETMLGGGSFERAEREGGRFRSYLLGAVKHFLAHHRETMRREKRGGGAELLSFDDENSAEARSLPASGVLSPDQAFDRQWAFTVLARALDVLRSESDRNPQIFHSIKPWLTGDAAHGDQALAAAACGMNANAFKVAVHRLRKRFRHVVKEEVAGTLEDPRQIDDEMRSLFAALGG